MGRQEDCAPFCHRNIVLHIVAPFIHSAGGPVQASPSGRPLERFSHSRCPGALGNNAAALNLGLISQSSTGIFDVNPGHEPVTEGSGFIPRLSHARSLTALGVASSVVDFSCKLLTTAKDLRRTGGIGYRNLENVTGDLVKLTTNLTARNISKGKMSADAADSAYVALTEDEEV